MLIMSTKPLTASATIESGERLREPEDDHARAEDARRRRAASCPRCAAAGGAPAEPGRERAHGRRAAQQAEPDRARVEDRLREERQQRDRAAEAARRRGRARSRRAAPACARMKRMPASSVCEARRLVRSARARGSRMSEDADEADREHHGRDAVDELGRDRRRAGRRARARRSIAAWNAIERSAIALAISSNGTSVAGSARAGRRSDRAARRRSRTRARGTARARRAVQRDDEQEQRDDDRHAVAPANRSRREKRSARCPAGSASSGSGTNSASPIRPRSSGEWWIS